MIEHKLNNKEAGIMPRKQTKGSTEAVTPTVAKAPARRPRKSATKAKGRKRA